MWVGSFVALLVLVVHNVGVFQIHKSICCEPQLLIATPPVNNLDHRLLIGLSVALAAEHDILVWYSQRPAESEPA